MCKPWRIAETGESGQFLPANRDVRRETARHRRATLAVFEGDGDIENPACRRHRGRPGPGDLTFFTNRKYLDGLRRTRASARHRRAGSDRRSLRHAAGQPSVSRVRQGRRCSSSTMWRPPAWRASGPATSAPVPSIARRRQDRRRSRWSATARAIGARTIVHSARDDRPLAREIGDDCVIHAQRLDPRARAASATASSCRTAPCIGSDGFGFAQPPDGTPSEDSADRRRGHRRRRRDRRQRDDRSPGRRRDAHRRRHARSTTSCRSRTA